MDQSKKKKTTQEDSQNVSQNNASGLIYWDDYDFDNQDSTTDYLEINIYAPVAQMDRASAF